MAIVEVTRGRRWLNSAEKCRLCVSIGSISCEGENLALLLQWANDNFRDCQLVLADTLQRHNLDSSMSDELRWLTTRKDGDNWIDRNNGALSRGGPRLVFNRWDDWLKRSDYNEALRAILQLEANSPTFTTALNRDIGDFLRRKGNPETTAQHHKSRNYILEELAVLSLVQTERPAVEFYPGSLPRVGSILANGEIPEAPESLRSLRLMEVRIRED